MIHNLAKNVLLKHNVCIGQWGTVKNRGGSRAAATAKMERFVTIVNGWKPFVIIVNGWKPLTIITKGSILDVAVVLDPVIA